jgi:hypothetical protein
LRERGARERMPVRPAELPSESDARHGQ